MSEKHTPGPWEAVRSSSDLDEWAGWRIKQPGSGLCDVAYVDDADAGPPVAEADARLIAAAPDLLAALEELYGWAAPLPEGMEQRVRLALEKARGA